MNTLIRAVQTVSRVLAWLAGLMIIVLMVIIAAEVAARYLFDRTIGGSVEIGELLLALVVFSSVAYAQQARAHVSTNLVTARLSPLLRTWVQLIGLTTVLVVVVWAVVATFERGMTSFEAGEATFGIRAVPLWPGRLLVPIGLGLLAIELLIMMRGIWRSRHDEADTQIESSSAYA